jgi:hypothetical protein
LNGVVEQTYLRGELIYDKGNVQTIAKGELITLPIADCRLPI